MADKTKQQLKVENNTSFPNNNTGFITPDKLRTFNEDIIDSFVNNDDTGSFTTDTGSLLETASVVDNTITFTKGDGSTFDVTVSGTTIDTGSFLTTGSFNSYTQSTDDRLTNIELETSSLQSEVDTLQTFTGSVETKFDTLATTTSSLETFTSSTDSRLDNIELNTSSYARTDTENTFQENQTLQKDLVVQGNLYVSGSEVIVSSSTLIVGDRIIEVNANKVVGDAGLYAFDAIGNQTGSLIWNPTLDYWLAGLSGSEEKVLVSSDTGSIETSLTNLNQYTQSTDARVNNLETFTGSQETKNTTLENVTSSLQSFTSSAEGRLNNIELTTQSLQSSIDQLELFSGSAEGRLNNIENLTGSLLQTASNDFSQVTFTKVDGEQFTLSTTPRQVIESVKNGNGQILYKGTPVYASGSVGNAQLVFPASASDETTMPAVYVLAQDLDVDEEGYGLTHGFINGVNTSTFNAGDAVYVGENGGFTNVRPTGTNLIQKLGTVVKIDPTNGSGVIQMDSIVSVPNIQEGYTWVGDTNGVAQPTPTSSFAESTDLSSLNAFTESADSRLNNIELTTASLENSVSQLNTFSGSTQNRLSQLETNSGSQDGRLNNLELFTSSQETINGFYNSYTSSTDIRLLTIELTTASLESSVNQLNIFTSSVVPTSTGSLLVTASVAVDTITFTKGDGTTFDITVASSGTAPSGTVSSSQQIIDLGFQLTSSFNSYTSSTDSRLNNIELVTSSLESSITQLNTFSASAITDITELKLSASLFAEKFDTIETQSGSWGGGGSTDISSLNAFTASAEIRLTNLETFTSSQEDINLTFATTGSNTFVGTQTFSGSIQNEVITQTITSQTASFDLSTTSYFTLILPASTETRIEVSNVSQGTTYNIEVTNEGDGTVVFGDNIYQPSSSLYIPTPTSESVDILTFVTFNDTNKVYVANVNNMI